MTKPTINDARWQEWTDKYLSAELSEPSRDKTGMIMGFFMTRRELDADELKLLDDDIARTFFYQVVQEHARRLGLNLDEEGKQFISLISENPAELVMHVHGARRLQQKLGVEELSMQQLFENAFDRGLRSEAVLQGLWDEQKLSTEERVTLGGGMDNYIDHVIDESTETI